MESPLEAVADQKAGNLMTGKLVLIEGFILPANGLVISVAGEDATWGLQSVEFF